MTDTVPRAEHSAQTEPPRLSADRVRHPLAIGVEALAAVPAVLMLLEVLKAPKLQFLDYWDVLQRMTNPDGSLHIPGMWLLKNEHPLVVPSMFFWINTKLAGGDNRVLGVVVVAVVVLTVLALRTALPRTVPPLARAGIVLAVSLLLFSPHGLHNFVRSMSGMAWLTANLLVLLALLAAVRGRWWLAWPVGMLACLSYGTAFPVWIALAAIAFARREPWWRRLVPLGLLLVVLVGWLALRPGVAEGRAPTTDLGTVAYSFFAVIGHVWTATDSGIAVAVGIAVIGGYGALLTSRSARTPGLLLWWTLGLHMVLACGMISVARIDFGTENSLSSRYTSLSVLATVPLLVIAATVASRRTPAGAPRVAVAAVTVGLMGFALGVPTATKLRAELREVPLQAISLRAGLTDAYPALLPGAGELVGLLPILNHYPFTPDFTLGCGGPELGSMLDTAAMSPLPTANPADRTAQAGWVEEVNTLSGAVVVRGWAGEPAAPLRCALLVDGTGRVTGGGVVGLPRPDVTRALPWFPADTGFAVIGPAIGPDTRVVVVTAAGTMLWAPAQPTGVPQ